MCSKFPTSRSEQVFSGCPNASKGSVHVTPDNLVIRPLCGRLRSGEVFFLNGSLFGRLNGRACFCVRTLRTVLRLSHQVACMD